MKKRNIMLLGMFVFLMLISACAKDKQPVVVEPPRNPLELAHNATKEALDAYEDNLFEDALMKFKESITLFEEASITASESDSVAVNIERMQLNIAKVYMDMALGNAQDQMFEDAVADYKEAVKIYKSLAPLTISTDEKAMSIATLYRNIAITLQNSGKFEDALTYYDMLLADDPGNEELLNIKYIILNDNLKDETRAFNVLIDYALASNDYKAYLILGAKYNEKKNTTEAAKYYEKALELNKGTDVLNRVADFYRSVNNWNRSNQVLQQLIDTKPDNATLASVYRIMGDNFDKLKNAAKKVESWEKSIALERNVDISLALASHFFSAKNYAKTITYATQVISQDSSKAAAFLLRGASYFNQKKFTEAKADLQRIQNDSRYGADAQKYLKAIK